MATINNLDSNRRVREILNRTGLAANNLTADRAPLASDDASPVNVTIADGSAMAVPGYEVGSIWQHGATRYTCTDATIGAAVWTVNEGVPGRDGDPGRNGDDGASAYGVALANGFVGTEIEWLASLTGKDGPQGEQGPAGADGSDAALPEGGVQGQVLAMGANGPVWIDLPDGPSPATVPAAPVLALIPGATTHESLSWDFTDGATGGAPITARKVEVRLTADDSLVDTLTAAPWSKAGLTASASYYALGFAQNSAGWSLASAAASGTTDAPPVFAPQFDRPPEVVGQPLVDEALYVMPPEVIGSPAPVTTYQWYDGDPEDGGTAISGWTDLNPTPVIGDYGVDLWLRTTATNSEGTASVDVNAGVVGRVFTEDFSGMAVGDDSYAILAHGWTRSDGRLNGLVVENEAAPSGKAMSWWTTTNISINCWRNDWAAFAAAHSMDDYEELMLVNIQDTSAHRVLLRCRDTSGFSELGHGFTINWGTIGAELPNEDPNAGVGWGLGSLVAGVPHWFRRRASGAEVSYKVWSSTVPEPANWGVTRTHTAPLVNLRPQFGTRLGGATKIAEMLYKATAWRASAPYPAGFVPPPLVITDPMAYAAPAPATSFEQNNALITGLAPVSPDTQAVAV